MGSNKNHILYIDDEKQNLSGFKYVFKKHYTVHVALSADEGWEILQQHPIKVILTDQRMPKVTGTQFLEKAAKAYPSIYRIIITGYTDVQDIIAAINQGKVFQFIRKPWDKEEVKVIIDNAIMLYDLKEHNNELLESLKNKNADLEEINSTLENKVKERTQELENHKENLEIKVKQRTRELEIAKDRAEESDRLKSAFLANVSHEIRTPMNAIIGFSELLITEELIEDDKNEFKEQIILNSNSLLRLIDDIIDISKIEANQIAIEYENHNLNQIISEVQAIFNEQKLTMDKAEVELIVEIPENQNTVISTDKIRLLQILSNLIGNALKFTEEGYVKFGYKFINKENKRLKIQFFVEDTGIGIHKEAQEYIFDRFRKVDLNKQKIFRGTGLGLFICKNLVEKFRGEIWIKSEPGNGATFYFEIPFITGENDQGNNFRDTGKGEKSLYDFSNKLILVAEDEDSNFDFIEKIIKETNAKIIRAKDGKEALELIKKYDSIDLVLMDIQMPVMDGYEAISLIKKENKKVPIIAQTAYALVNQQQDVLDAGCDGFLSKPFQKKELLGIIESYIRS